MTRQDLLFESKDEWKSRMYLPGYSSSHISKILAINKKAEARNVEVKKSGRLSTLPAEAKRRTLVKPKIRPK